LRVVGGLFLRRSLLIKGVLFFLCGLVFFSFFVCVAYIILCVGKKGIKMFWLREKTLEEIGRQFFNIGALSFAGAFLVNIGKGGDLIWATIGLWWAIVFSIVGAAFIEISKKGGK